MIKERAKKMIKMQINWKSYKMEAWRIEKKRFGMKIMREIIGLLNKEVFWIKIEESMKRNRETFLVNRLYMRKSYWKESNLRMKKRNKVKLNKLICIRETITKIINNNKQTKFIRFIKRFWMQNLLTNQNHLTISIMILINF